MSEAERLATEVEDMPFKGWSTDINKRVAAELRRLSAELDEVRADRDSWAQQASDRAGEAVAAIEELEALKKAISEAQGVPDWWLDVLDNFEKKERSPFLAYLAAGLVNELRTAMLASAPPAPQAEELVLWKARALQAEAIVAKFMEPQAAVVQQEPAAWKHDCAVLLTNDVELWIDACPHCGKPRTHPAQQAKPQPLSDEQVNRLYEIAVKAHKFVTRQDFERGLRAAEAVHGIKE